MTGGQANFLQSLGWAVLNSLWQFALLWLIYQLITTFVRSTRSSTKSALASGLLIGGFSWFLFTFFSVYSNHSIPLIASPAVAANTNSNAELNEWLQQTLPFASATYLILLVFPALQFIKNYRYVQVIRQYGLTKMDVNWRVFIQKIATQMGIKKPVHIWVSELVSSPVTIGFLKPVILVPLAAINHLTPQQLEAVLLHELSHIRRADYLVNLLINFIQTILYFNPFVKAFVKIVEKEREKSCDEMVLQFQYDSYEYASALLTLEQAEHKSQTLVMGVTGKRTDLLTRVEIIMGIHKNPVISFNKLAGLMAGMLCIIAVNALFIVSKPYPGNKGIIARFSSISASLAERPPGREVRSIHTEGMDRSIVNRPSKQNNATQITNEALTPAGFIVSAFNDPEFADHSEGIQLAGFESLAEIPVLKKYQEEVVKEALAASKKVLESKQWKAMEQSIADVFTQKEKEVIEAGYKAEFEKFNWEQWENNLRIAYDQVDWDKVNTQLYNAVNQVRLDSLHKVYVKAIDKLNEVHHELVVNNLKGIPDTDVSLKRVEQKKIEVQRVINTLKGVRTKKIVHL